MEGIVLGLFCAALLLCIMMDVSILYALTAGLLLFLLYGRKKGHSWKVLFGMALSGVKTVKNILITFVLIGMLTALWRAAGTVPVIVCYAVRLIRPSLFLVMTFLLNSLLSVLTGTSFGTAATMGVICTTMAAAMKINPLLVGGAVLSGIFVGDRCSPVSTSALLVAELTKTNIFQNIKNMVRSAAVTFLITCVFYTVVGFLSGHEGEIPNLQEVFGREFRLSWIALLPAVVLLVLALMQVNVKIVMAASILTALPICMMVQQITAAELPGLLWKGFYAQDAEVAAMMNGGGILSMVKVSAIVCLSSSYSGLFGGTGLLDGVQHLIEKFAKKTTAYTAILVTSVISSIIACNQTLTIMLTHQLCGHVETDTDKMALNLEDTAVVIAPLVPWSIAGAVPLASIGAPATALLLACFLYLLPMWRLLEECVKK